MNNKIYLATCFSLDFDLPILEHFIEHNLSLGLPSENCLVVLNVFKDFSNLEKGLNILKKYNIFPKDIWCYEYESEEKWQRVHMILSKHVTKDDWVVHPDSDEFHEFPNDNLIQTLNFCDAQKINAIQGYLIDRITEDGKLINVKSQTNINEQFPKKINLTKLIGLSGVKLMVYKGYLRANNGSGQIHPQVKNITKYTHGANSCLSSTELSRKILGDPSDMQRVYIQEEFNESVYQAMKTQHGFFVHHFKWHGEVIEKLEQRVETYRKLNRPQIFQSERLLNFYKENNESFLKNITKSEVKGEKTIWNKKLIRSGN